jgi:hypothetical protein
VIGARNMIFVYPKSIQATKSYLRIVSIASILFTPIILLNNGIDRYSSVLDYVVSLILPYSLLPITCISYIGAWPNIKILENGLEIDFLWRSLYVPFNEIIGINHTGSDKFGLTLVKVKPGFLTAFHRVYGFITFQTANPCFYIHPNIQNYQSLLNKITANISRS